jgi:hypothetical protein
METQHEVRAMTKKPGRPKERKGEYERITLEVRKDVLKFVDKQPATRRIVYEGWAFQAMNEQLRKNITPTQIINVEDEQTRRNVCDVLDQYYWSDNGGETDGSAYLIEANELPEKHWAALTLRPTDGTYLDNYEADEHAEKLNAMGVNWTGWQAEGYALIAASPEDVFKALSVE